MTLKSLNCPNCGGTYSLSNKCCEYCGSYLIYVDNNDKQPKNFEETMFLKESKKFVCGVRLNDNEYPIRVCTGAYIKSIWMNVSGWLVLTNVRFLLVDYKHNVILDIPIHNITSVESGVIGLTGNLHIITYNKRYKFNTYGYKEWEEKIISIRK